jgi:hypothetical protein
MERVHWHQKQIADYRNSCAEYNNNAFSWGSSASSSWDTWTPPTGTPGPADTPGGPQTWTPRPANPPPVVPAHAPADTPAEVVIIPDPATTRAQPNTSSQQQLFQMHQDLATTQMTMMMQLAQTNTEQSQAMLRTLMEVMLRIGSNRLDGTLGSNRPDGADGNQGSG